VLRLLREALESVTGEPPRSAGMKSWTDAEPLARAGIRCVVFGPGQLRDAHTEREGVRIADVVTAACTLHQVIRRVPTALHAPS